MTLRHKDGSDSLGLNDADSDSLTMEDKASQDSKSEQLDPFAWANLNRWAARAYWTPAEIAALSLFKDPRHLNLEHALQHIQNDFAFEYVERLDVAFRAAEMSHIPFKCPPNIAIEWLDKMGIGDTSLLKAEVGKFHPVTDWKLVFKQFVEASYERSQELQAAIENHQKALQQANMEKQTSEARSKQLEKFVQQLARSNDELCVELQEMEQQLIECEQDDHIPANDNSADLNPKSERSKDLMIVAMAIVGYKFDPAAARSTVPKEIEDDIARLGKSLTSETCAKQLRSACESVGITKDPRKED